MSITARRGGSEGLRKMYMFCPNIQYLTYLHYGRNKILLTLDLHRVNQVQLDHVKLKLYIRYSVNRGLSV